MLTIGVELPTIRIQPLFIDVDIALPIDDDFDAAFGIEAEYLWPLIKSPKDTNTIKVDPADLTLRIFVCRRSKTELKKLGHKGSLKYIEWGEQQTYVTGTFKGLKWPQGTWVAKREPGWYALPNTEINLGQVFMSEAFGEAHIHRFCLQKLVPDKRLYFLEPSQAVSDAEDVAAVLINQFISRSTFVDYAVVE